MSANKRLSPDTLDYIRKNYDLGVSITALAKGNGLARSTIRDIVTNPSYGVEQVREHKAVTPAPIDPVATVESISAGERERMRQRAQAVAFNELKKQKAMTDEIIDALTRLMVEMPVVSIRPHPMPSSKRRPQTAIQLLSDTHIGNHVDPEETGGLGNYSYEIFLERLNGLGAAIRSIVNGYHRPVHPVPRLVMPFLGDMIENIEIFGSQLEGVDLPLAKQFLFAVDDLSQFIVELLDTFETIFVPILTGNHGRIGRKGAHKRHLNWDYLIGEMIKRKLEPYRDRITIEVPMAAFALIDIEGYRWLLRHGDGIKSWGGIPYYGIQRSTGRWIAILAADNKRFDYMAMGHFHAPAHLPFTGGETIINGCFPGTTEFSVEVIESLSRPMQFFGMVHPEHGLGARYPIYLDGGKKLSPIITQPHTE